ncbi:hypothetical protein Pla22_14220 [Rubripirellula amarantea]|uniref:FAD-dependent urate hydroxylase HpyO/Asp monooxygenase CreE-like FAD/NAD(P)-binding domain-containing protein n=1 Tax=Rubripirellula amarantea TaxID=2527999 RepID=A0A5C5WU88_9BACT|nr:FAD/NAD(P)-binding domain-containing protein [Rubripirellula amarantea]TWT53789.1 hypothetical protein Pla22_14220 [Rubripirellula amarantea]
MSSVITNRHVVDSTRSTSNSDRFRIAIVGCGPRGLQCLEAMSRLLTTDQLSCLEITLFEPASKPGAGRVYDPSQSHVLRMNFATQFVDFWKTDTNLPSRRSESLIGWLSKHRPEWATADQFVPRAVVGEYLHECFTTVWKNLSQHALVEWKPTVVRRIAKTSKGWSIGDESDTRHYDHVVITTGHEGIRGSKVSDSNVEEPCESFVFPVERQLSKERIPAGSRVSIRGFGLTAIDAILMLTQGRDGEFVDGPRLPSYVPSLDEPSRIDVYSRSGRPMLAKPTAKVEPITSDFWQPFKEELMHRKSRHGELHFRNDVWRIVTTAAAALLNRAGQNYQSQHVDNWYRGWLHYKMDAASARRAMLQSYWVATGQRPKDIPFAIGESWRKLYPELVELIGYGGLESESWRCYDRTRCEMERIAFGPPAESVGMILSLLRSKHVCCHVLANEDENLAAQLESERRLNAVLASPSEFQPSGLLADLVETGVVKRDQISGGLVVDQAGCANGDAGSLAIFGRATEGWVIGNDTLSRTLHQQIENWAQKLATQVVCPTSS